MQQRSVKCVAVASEHHMTRRALLPSMMRLLRQAHPELSFQTLQVLMHFMAAGDEDGTHGAAAQEPAAGAAAAVSAAAAAERAGLTEEQMESPAFVERVLHASHRLERRLPVRAVQGLGWVERCRFQGLDFDACRLAADIACINVYILSKLESIEHWSILIERSQAR